jgi:branched-chain amino acid transport system substrate-binding protein
VIRTMGPECEGIVTSAHFAEGADLPATQAFVKNYSEKFSKIPSLYAFSHYVGAMWVAKAIDAIHGNVEDRDTFLATVLKTDLPDSPLGKPVRFDDYGNPIYDVFIRKTVKNKDGKYWNSPIETYPQVSQFWKYAPETYMKQPPYSRDFQGIKKS